MRFAGFAAIIAASLLSSAASASTVTYTLSGTLSTNRYFDDTGQTLAAALANATTFVATFAINSGASDSSPDSGSGIFRGVSASIKLDGRDFLTSPASQTLNELWNINYSPDFQLLQFLAYDRTDRVAAVAGPEDLSFKVSFYVPANTINVDLLPLSNAFYASAIFADASATIGNGFYDGSRYHDRALGLAVDSVSVSISPAPRTRRVGDDGGGLGIVGAVARRRRKG